MHVFPYSVEIRDLTAKIHPEFLRFLKKNVEIWDETVYYISRIDTEFQGSP